jgi:xanthine dehydrogenase YagR molybdenum-binding subunit
LPLAPRTAGSWGTASVAPVVAIASENLRRKIIAAACADPASPLHGSDPEQVQVTDGRLFIDGGSHSDTYAAIAPRRGANGIAAWGELGVSAAEPDRSMHAFGVNFVEVAVDESLGELRVRRIVACYAAGHILNDKMAHSQMVGGLVLGVGMTLGETCLVDPHLGRSVNASLDGYLIPVNADIASIDVSFVDEDDPHVNPTGVKGIGMLGTVGIAAAIANAVFHATGKRIRDLPITAEKLM